MTHVLHAKILDDGSTVCPHCEVPSNKWSIGASGRRCPCGLIWHTSKLSKMNPIKENLVPYCYIASYHSEELRLL